MSVKAAQIVAEKLKQLKQPILGLATGSTPIKTYENLVEKYRQGEISFANAITFNLDEYVGLSIEDPTSYHYFMDYHLFKHIDIKPENIHLPDGMAEDLEEECKNYEKMIENVGKIALQILCLGLNGHIGFNEPGISFSSRTHVVDLTPSTTIEANVRFFENIDDVPRKALTIGVQTIMEAKEILFIVNGEKKADIFKESRAR